MKHSQSSIFNNSVKTKDNNFIKTGFSIINQNTISSNKFNNSITAIKFPKIFFRIKNRKLNQKNKTQYNDYINMSKSLEKYSFKDSFNILHFDKKDDKSNKSNESNKCLPNLRYINNNIKDNEKTNINNMNKNLSLLYNNYQNIKNKVTNFFNIYDSLFDVKIKKRIIEKFYHVINEKDNKHMQ